MSRRGRVALPWRRARSLAPLAGSRAESGATSPYLVGLGGECEIVLRTCFCSRLINEAYRGPRLAALPENRPRRNQVAPVCDAQCSYLPRASSTARRTSTRARWERNSALAAVS